MMCLLGLGGGVLMVKSKVNLAIDFEQNFQKS